MLTDAEKIQAVLNTLGLLQIPATYENADRMIGIYRTLTEVRDSIGISIETREGSGEHAGEHPAE